MPLMRGFARRPYPANIIEPDKANGSGQEVRAEVKQFQSKLQVIIGNAFAGKPVCMKTPEVLCATELHLLEISGIADDHAYARADSDDQYRIFIGIELATEF